MGMCETAAGALKQKQVPEITEKVATQSSLEENRFSFTPARRTGTGLVAKDDSVGFEIIDEAEYKKLTEVEDDEDFV